MPTTRVRNTADERFATIRGGSRIWAVGSIHGEAERLRRLHAALAERFRPGDRIVYLGNYLGWGAGVAAAVDEMVAFRGSLLAVPRMGVCDVVHLRGSQEEMWQKLLQLHLAIEPEAVFRWILDRGVRQTLEAYGWEAAAAGHKVRAGAREIARWTNDVRASMERHPGHRALLGSLRRAAFTADRGLLFVNANVDATRPVDAQNDAFWWGGEALAQLTPPYGDFKKIVRGFDPARRGVCLDAYVATLDGGAGFGGTLSAACFDAEGRALDRIDA